MEEQDRSRSPSRRTSRVEQVVGRWLRRSRDLGSRSHSLSRDRILVEGKPGESATSDQRNYPFRFIVQIQRNPELNSHGLSLTSQTPILVQDVTPGGPADGRLVPGDQLVKINNVAVEDLTPGQAAEIMRECQDTVTMTVLRTMVGPKSSFITPEKRAKLKSNPVKVRFAEEVEVNGNSQGNALLFLPNVLKVYLENGQTKAFKFEPNTTVKDIVMTLKEKLSLSRIEHFSLVLEQQYSITKLLLLHEEERIQQVVQKKEAHDYRCLFRVCYMPRDPQDLLLDDPTAFEYLYLQGVNDVLQERFAVEMRCNTALRLAALHIQERLASCGQSPKTNLKTITKTWGIENFVSSTLLRNMREKDLRKAICFHMKKSQSQQDPKQKGLSFNQARLNYLQELSELKSFGGKSFSATIMLQDRESMVSLLVGARYGVSQVINHKLSIMTTLTEFTSITRIELLPESDRISLVKIYLQDIKPITLLLESVAAKDMSCLIAGYCRVLVNPNLHIFPWPEKSRKHRVSAEEGYVSRCGSDSETSSDMEMDPLVHPAPHDDKPRPRIRSSSDPERTKRKERGSTAGGKAKGDKPWRCRKEKQEKDADTEKAKSPPSSDKRTENQEEDEVGREKADEEIGVKVDRKTETGPIQIEITKADSGEVEEPLRVEGEEGAVGAEEPFSEASDSCRTDSRCLTSPSSDSLDALEEDDLISCSSSIRTHLDPHSQGPSSPFPSQKLHPHTHAHPHPHLLAPPPAHSHPLISLASELLAHDRLGDPRADKREAGACRRSGDGADPDLSPSTLYCSSTCSHADEPLIDSCSGDSFMGFAELSLHMDYLPSPPEVSEEEDEEEEELRRQRRKLTEFVKRTAEGGGETGAEMRAGVGAPQTFFLSEAPISSSSPRTDYVFNFEQSDARCYYKLCSSVTPDSALSPPRPMPHPEGVQQTDRGAGEQAEAVQPEPVPILQPPPGFGDSSSDEEFYDAWDRFASPEDPTSGATPRDYSAEMKPNFLRTLSLGDIGVFVEETEDGQTEKEGEEGGGGETLLQLRRRSRKRRSFMETNFTSRVTFPKPDAISRRNLISNRPQREILAQASNNQPLNVDPEASEQSQTLCPTVASLTHSEGEPAQLESKPIPSCGPGSPNGSDSLDQDRDPCALPRVQKQEMEMEPDAMESKSVTDLVTMAPPSITVVRCRVEPDGKESADRRGDGKEEGEGGNEEREGGKKEGEIIGEGKKEDREGEEVKQELKKLSPNGPLTDHKLSEIIEESDKHEEAGYEIFGREWGRKSLNSERSFKGAVMPGEDNVSSTVVCDTNAEGSNVFVGPQISYVMENACRKDYNSDTIIGDDFKPPTHLPPRPPPNSPLAPLPVVDKSWNQHVSLPQQIGIKDTENLEETCKGSSSELLLAKHHREEFDAEVKNEICSTASSGTTSDDVNDRIMSENVFDDDISNSLCSSYIDGKAANNSYSNDSNKENKRKVEEPTSIFLPPDSKLKRHYTSDSITQMTSLNSDYQSTINSIKAKLGVATSAMSPLLNAGGPVHQEAAGDIELCTDEDVDIFRSDSPMLASGSKITSATVSEATTKHSVNPCIGLAKANSATLNNLSKEPPSPTHFLFQTCSPSIMGRLSASTLRGKIQRLPLYLSRSQETVAQDGSNTVANSPCQDISRDDGEITIKITDVDNVTQTIDFEMFTRQDSVDSDDSDVTVTGSEVEDEMGVEGEAVAETTTDEMTYSTVSDVKLVERVGMGNKNPAFPVQTEPKTIPQSHVSSGPYKDTPGPIVTPPISIAGSVNLKMDTSDTIIDTPGPIKEAPESMMKMGSPISNIPGLVINSHSSAIASPIVVTTETHNGPGLSFYSRPEKAGRTSSDRPLVGLCNPTAALSLKTLSSAGCEMFTMCEDQSQIKSVSNPTTKPDLGCSSVLTSGCESVVEGLQAPLEACGCPAVYTHCFSGGDNFDDELTVYEFSCRSQNSGVGRTSGVGLPLITSAPVTSFLSKSLPSFPASTLSPSFPRSVIFSSPTSELSPLLSPLSDTTDNVLLHTHKETLGSLCQHSYPAAPAGFQTLRSDVDQLLSVLEGGGAERSVGSHGGRHARESCPAHFTENKRMLHVEARHLMAGCQKVAGLGQSPEEMLISLADSFRHLVELAGVCLWFSGCDRCDRRNAEAVAGLVGVGRSFRDFCLAAERACSKKSCQDLSAKLLAKQCTALTASVFCLTQLFRSLTEL